MSTDTEATLLRWRDDEGDFDDAAWEHFDAIVDECDIAAEARRLLNLLFDMGIEKDSPLDTILNAAILNAYHVGIDKVARVIGVDPAMLMGVADMRPPTPIGLDGLAEEIASHRAVMAAYEAELKDAAK